MSRPEVIRIDGVSKKFTVHKDKSLKERVVNSGRSRLHAEEYWALQDVSFSIDAGESIGLAGANGSGKSTLVKAVLGLVPPAGGSIEVLGTPTTRRHRVPWQRIGYVPQRIGAGSGVPATALEVVRSGLLGPRRPWADRGRTAKRKAMAALDAVGLAHRAGDHVQVFSGGQAQRVLIARALVRSPELLILDEPLAGIDRASRESLAMILQGLRAQGLTLVTVLHEMGELADVVQRAILLQDGQLVADGPAAEVARLRDGRVGVSVSGGGYWDHGDHHPDAGGPPAHHAPVLDHRLPEARPSTGRSTRP